MAVTNLSFPTDDYPELGDPLDPEPLRKNFSFLKNHALRHQQSGEDTIDASKLDGQGHNGGFNADKLDGLHLNDVLSQIRELIQETLVSGTGQTETITSETTYQDSADTVSLNSSGDISIEIDQGANDKTDPLNPLFDDEPTGSDITFTSGERYAVRYEIPLPRYFISVSNVDVRKENLDFSEGEEYQGLFRPFLEDTDNNGDPVERPEIIDIDLTDQILVIEAILPSEISYVDENGNTVEVINSGSFVDNPDQFRWSIEITGEVPDVKGHAERHFSDGLDPIDVSKLKGQGHQQGFNADLLDGLHAKSIARLSPGSPSRINIQTFSNRAEDLYLNIWYEGAHNGLILGLVGANDQISGSVEIDVTPSDTFIDEAEFIETRVMGQQLRDDGNSLIQPNNSPNMKTGSGNIAGIFLFQDDPRFDEELTLSVSVVDNTELVRGSVQIGTLYEVGTFVSGNTSDTFTFNLFTTVNEATSMTIGG